MPRRHRRIELPIPGEVWKEVSVLEGYYKERRHVDLCDVLRLVRYAVHLEEVYGPNLLERFERSQERPIYIHLKDGVDNSEKS